MAGAIAMPVTYTATADVKTHYRQMPLTFANVGERMQVLKVRGKGEVHHHLENLGFVEGTPITVVSETAGNLIVEVKGAHVGLDRTAASRIIVA